MFARRIHLNERYAMAIGHATGHETVRERHKKNLERAFLLAAFERYNRVASAHSIEPRHPYSDRRLIEFCLALPVEQKNDQGLEKVINRRAVESMLPYEVAWRTESTHLVFYFSSARFRCQQADILKTLRSEQMSLIAPYVDSDKVETIVQAAVNFTFDQSFDILRLYSIANWFWHHHLLIH